jgi:hypothetical protein
MELKIRAYPKTCEPLALASGQDYQLNQATRWAGPRLAPSAH